MIKEVKVAELFAGVGGFRLGLENASDKYKTIWADQYEPSRKQQFAYEIYRKNFDDVISNEDISNVNKEKIPNFDLLVGGFPCQDYSVVRAARLSKGIYGKKGVLWWDIIKTINKKNPRFIFLENVDRLLASPGVNSSNPGRDFGMILKTLSENNYGVNWKVINAAEYGHPQRRRRTFIFAFREDTNYFSRFEEKLRHTSPEYVLKNCGPLSDTLKNNSLKGNIQNINLKNKDFDTLPDFSKNFKVKGGFKKLGFMLRNNVFASDYIPEQKKPIPLSKIIKSNEKDETLYLSKEKDEKMAKSRERINLIKTSKSGFDYPYGMGKMVYPDSLDKPARTMVTSEHSVSRMSHVIIDPGNKRKRFISPEEAELINTFPEGWTNIDGISKSARYFLMGNALVVNLVSDIAKDIIKITNEEPNKSYKFLKTKNITDDIIIK